MLTVVKASGQKEFFSEEKLRDSIRRARIPARLEDKAIAHVKSRLYENIPTSEVYKHITEFLDKEPEKTTIKYSLKQAIMDLGPTGYPFEDYVSEILKAKGYATQVRTILNGRCVTHEIDVIAEKVNIEKLMIEAKYHNASGIKTEVHVPLYTKARFEDLKEKYKFTKAWLFTNTKITSDGLTYALCIDMGVTSWNFPQNESLRDLIEEEKLYPVTMLSSLSESYKQILLDNHIVLIKEICKNNDTLDLLRVQNSRKKSISEEAQAVCELG